MSWPAELTSLLLLMRSTDDTVGYSSNYSKTASHFAPVTAVTVFGDPSFTANQTFDRGTSTDDGVFARRDDGASLALLKTYSGVLRSYCDGNDTFCASGDSLDTHYAEVGKYAQAATDFVVGLA